MFGGLGIWELLIVLFIIMIFFGVGKLPEIGRGLGEGIKNFNHRFYPTKITMEDKLRENSKTDMLIKKVDFDISIPEETFSERRLMKK